MGLADSAVLVPGWCRDRTPVEAWKIKAKTIHFFPRQIWKDIVRHGRGVLPVYPAAWRSGEPIVLLEETAGSR